jgi:hypothetical protein
MQFPGDMQQISPEGLTGCMSRSQHRQPQGIFYMNRRRKVLQMHTKSTSSKGRSATPAVIDTDPDNGDESTRRDVEKGGENAVEHPRIPVRHSYCLKKGAALDAECQMS